MEKGKDSFASVSIDKLVTGYRNKDSSVRISGPLDAVLKRGELTCLLGPNGAGKSTLLKTLSGALPPLSGNIEINSRRLEAYSPRELAMVIGLVLTEKSMVGNMKVEQLVAMGRSPYTGFWGRLSNNDRLLVEEALSLVKIEELSGRTVASLSDGERQKVMIAKALAQETPVIFLDEPTAFLDFPGKVELMRLLRRLAHEEGKTVFLSTHDLDIALATTDYVWLIDPELGLLTGDVDTVGRAEHLDRYFRHGGLHYNPDSRHFEIN